MSGGRFDYKDFELKDEIFGWVEDLNRIPNVFEDREISELIWDVFELIHDFDWYKSGDTNEEDYLKAKNEFKDKWFKRDSAERMKEITDAALIELKEDLYKTFGIEAKDDLSRV